MTEPEPLALGAGGAVVFSRACPGREGANEDSAAVFELGADRAVLAVADGMGGRPAGESASRSLLRGLGRALAAVNPNGDSLRGAILDALEQGNRRLLDAGVGAATTLVVVELAGDQLRPYHVGDSAILAVGQRGRIKHQSVAHSPVGYAIEAGLLDEEEALHHEERHLVSNAVGTPDMRIEVGSPLRLAARDTLLLGTDGLFDNMGLSEIVETVRCGPLDRAAGALARRCRRRMTAPEPDHPSKPDDLTFVMFRRTGRSEPHRP